MLVDLSNFLKAAIGLDHLIIETLLKGGTLNLAIAKETYEQGASSFSYAEVILDTPLEGVLEAGTVVVGASYANVGDVMGTVLETVDTGSDVVKIRYSVRDDQANYLNCRVGGAPEPFHVLDECELW